MKCVGRPLYNIICVYALKHGQAPVSISYEIKFDLCTIVFGVLDVWKFCMDIKLVRLQMHRIFLSAFLTSFLLIAPVVFRTQKESNFLWYRISIYSVSYNFIYPSKELCSKMALGEVGLSLPWWRPCPFIYRLLKTFFKSHNFFIMEKWPVWEGILGQSWKS